LEGTSFFHKLLTDSNTWSNASCCRKSTSMGWCPC
jgi:hypothetical protein